VSLRDLFGIVYKRRLLVAGILGAVVFVVAVATMMTTPMYESTSTILVKFGRPQSIYRPQIGEVDAMISRDQETLLNSELEILRGEGLISDVVRSLGVETLYPDLAAESDDDAFLIQSATRKFAAVYSVEAVKGTEVIHVSFRHADPEMSARAVSLVVDRFKQKHLEAHSDPELSRFLAEQAAISQQQLESAEDHLRRFEADHPHFAVESPGDMLLEKQEVLASGRRDIEDRIAAVRRQLAQEHPAISQIKAQLVRLQLEEKELLGTYLETSRPVVNIRKEIRRVSEFLQEEQAAQGQKSEFMELRRLEQGKARIQGESQELEQQMSELAPLKKQYRGLVRDRNAREENYLVYQKKLEEARLSQAMDQQNIANISVIQEAVARSRPVSPRKKVNLALGVFFGVALGMLAAYFAESIRPTST